MNFKRILVPLDGSPIAESGLRRAIEMCGSDTELLVLRAAEAYSLPGAESSQAQVLVVREAEEYLAEVAAGLAREGIERVETSVWYGPAAAAIVEAARLRKADLIVMTTHGRSGLGRLIMGSVAESVLRGTTTPILLLRASEAPVEAPRGEGAARPTEASHV